MKIHYPIAGFCLTALLSACGGGGGGEAAITPGTVQSTGSAEGFYQGTESTGMNRDMVVLEDGSFWSFSYLNGFSGNKEVLTGTGTLNNGDFTSANARHSRRTGTLTAAFTPGSSFNSTEIYPDVLGFNGVVVNGATKTTFQGLTPPKTTFDYNTPANLSDIAGTWNGTMMTNGNNFHTNLNLTITDAGVVSAIFQTTPFLCEVTGTTTPRPSNKNVFNVTLNFSNLSSCPLAGNTVNGVAVNYLLPNNQRQLVLIAPEYLSGGALFTAQR